MKEKVKVVNIIKGGFGMYKKKIIIVFKKKEGYLYWITDEDNKLIQNKAFEEGETYTISFTNSYRNDLEKDEIGKYIARVAIV